MDHVRRANVLAAIAAGLRRLDVRWFRGPLYVLPFVCADSEPGAWGHPGCLWISAGWLRWSLTVYVYPRPCEGCLGWRPHARE